MQRSNKLSPTRRLSTALACCIVALVATFATNTVRAQTLIADYPMLTDLLDAAKNFSPITLTGNPTPPAQPANGIFVNGIYRYATGGQDVRTPLITNLDATDFMFEIEFRIKAYPLSTRGAPALMAGNSYRWLGIFISPTGVAGIKYNNSNFIWSKTTLKTGTWYSAVLMYERGSLRLLIDGVVVHQATIPALNTGGNLNFTTNDFSSGLAHHGSIRRLRVWNNANLKGGLFTVAGNHCHGLQISGAMPWPSVNKIYKVSVSGGNAGGPALLMMGFRQPTSLDLGPAGAPGCNLFVNPLILFSTVINPTGDAFTYIPIPQFVGVTARFQWVNFDPKANPLSCRISDYATLVIGN